jgi:hypothetical protein
MPRTARVRSAIPSTCARLVEGSLIDLRVAVSTIGSDPREERRGLHFVAATPRPR